MPSGSLSPDCESEQLYFAYGSNMHLGQMCRRCPSSRYIGTARLQDYRFHINERGYANVLPSAGHSVEGLVYLINKDDEMKLDKNEGVSRAFYAKKLLPIELFPASPNHVGRLVFDVAQQLKERGEDSTQAESSTISADFTDQSSINHRQPSPQKQDARRSFSADGRHAFDDTIDTTSTQMGHVTKALVYVSLQYQENGPIRDEYIERMTAAIIDARKLGVSEWYVRQLVRNCIPKPEKNSLPAHDSYRDR